jgi:hypothetical protein
MGSRVSAVLAALALLPACAVQSNWHLMDSGYSIDPSDGKGFAMEVHLNQLKEIGGGVHSPEFRRFVGERLKWHGLCPSGWAFLPCTEDGSCLQHTRRSVTVLGQCKAP